MEEYVTRTKKSVFNATARCSRCVSTIRGTGKTGTHREWTKTHQRRVERHREGGSGAKASEGRALRPSGREVTKRTKSNPEEEQMDVPTASKTMTNSSSRSTTPASSSSSTVGTGSPGGDTRPNRVGNKRKADAEHLEDAEGEDEKWMRTVAKNRKPVEEDEESMVRKTMQYLKTLEKAETRKESEGLVVNPGVGPRSR